MLIDHLKILFEVEGGQASAQIDALESAADGAAGKIDDVGKAAGKATQGTRGLAAGLVDADKAATGLQQRALSFAGGLIASLVGGISVAAIQGMATGAATRIEALTKEAKQLRVSAPDLDAFRAGLNAIGVEAETSTGVLSKLGDTIQEATTDRASKSAANLNALGIRVKSTTGEIKTSLQVMLELSDKMAGKSEGAANKIASRFGITDVAQIELLRRGRRAIVEAMDAEKERGVVTERQIEIQKEYKRETEAWARVMEIGANKTMELVLPAMTRMISGLRQVVGWLRENQGFVKGFFVTVAGVITAVYLPAVVKATLATFALLAPYLLIIAALALFALALDDVNSYLKGQPSVLGELEKKYPEVAQAIRMLGGVFRWLRGESEDSVDGMKRGPTSLMDIWGQEWARFKSDAKGAFDSVSDAYTWLQDRLKSGGWDGVILGLVEAFEKAGLAMQQKFDAAIDYMISAVKRLGAAILNLPVINWFGGGGPPSLPGTSTPTPGVQVPTGGGAPVTVPPPVPTGGAGQKLGRAEDPVPEGLRQGRRQLASATSAPFSAGRPGAGAASEVKNDNRKIDVRGGPVTITAGLSAAEVEGAVNRANAKMIRSAVTAFDDGVKA